MCYVIVTSRTLLWCLLTIATALATLASVITPSWLIGPPRRPGLRSRNSPQVLGPSWNQNNAEALEVYAPTLGIYNRCTKLHKFDALFTDNCAPFVTSLSMPSQEFPDFWKASLVFFSCGLVLMTLTVLASLFGCCLRSIAKKSIFTLAGTVQAIAGLLYILGLVLYPAGWGSRRVQIVCGEKSAPYQLGDCDLGWPFYLTIGSTVVTFVCSVLSVQADISTSSDKVQDEILEGKTLICLL